MVRKTPGAVPVIGWREWIALPGFGIESIKAKIDTGARTSSLHVVDLERYRSDGKDWVRFGIHPMQRRTRDPVRASAEVTEYRRVRSSSGQASLRPVILTEVELLGRRWPIEVTLANRAAMGFRMLLGREAIRGKFHVDPGRSFYAGPPARKAKQTTPKARKKHPTA